ncbi:MAG: UvrB/UvrC motif-containing protein [Candidatus Omnitrophota bacterium]
MICDICHKKEATIHITEIVNGEASELHVCQSCAEAESIKAQQSFGIADLLSGLVDFPTLAEEKEQYLKCPSCGMTYSDFRKIGRLGCSDCYMAFNKALLPLLKNIHGSTHHTGKEPKALPAGGETEHPEEIKELTSYEKIQHLKQKLQQAIRSEDYEKAAALRDRIRDLEKEPK